MRIYSYLLCFCDNIDIYIFCVVIIRMDVVVIIDNFLLYLGV